MPLPWPVSFVAIKSSGTIQYLPYEDDPGHYGSCACAVEGGGGGAQEGETRGEIWVHLVAFVERG